MEKAFNPGAELSPSSIDSAVFRFQSALKAAFYSAARYAVWRVAFPSHALEAEMMARDLQQSFAFRLRFAGRRELHSALRRLDWQDLATLPLFLLTAPFDIVRVLEKRFLGRRALPVRPPDAYPYPSYYLYDFHHQANGNLSARAAATYEWQIRFLFLGCNRLMRQAVIDQIPQGDELDILDVACGTGAWITQARLQGRRHRVTGVDLSPSYLRLARDDAKLDMALQMNAEELPADWTGRFDLVTCVWLYHELPPEAQERVTAECTRVLKPGGRLLFLEALQWRDAPDLREKLGGKSLFQELFNEPHFEKYLELDLSSLFERHGLTLEGEEHWYKSKLLRLRKPLSTSP